MAKKASEYAFSYVARIEDEALDVLCKDANGKQIGKLTVDLSELQGLTFKDEDFGGGKETPYTFGDWWPAYAVWIHLSARTSSLKGLEKLEGMREVLAMHRAGRFKAERATPGGGGFSYQIQAIANLRKAKYAEIAAAKKAYDKEKWEKIVAALQPQLGEEIQRLKDEAEAKASDSLFDDLLD